MRIQCWPTRVGSHLVVFFMLLCLAAGSVKAASAVELFGMPDIDGGLVGGASLNADEFGAICRAAGN